MSDEKRDLAADLALCEAATHGPWVTNNPKYGGCLPTIYATSAWQKEDGGPKQIFRLYQSMTGHGDALQLEVSLEADWDDVDFICAAREGWPHAIRRAQAAEARVEELERSNAFLFKELEDCREDFHEAAAELSDLRAKYRHACDRIAANPGEAGR